MTDYLVVRQIAMSVTAASPEAAERCAMEGRGQIIEAQTISVEPIVAPEDATVTEVDWRSQFHPARTSSVPEKRVFAELQTRIPAHAHLLRYKRDRTIQVYSPSVPDLQVYEFVLTSAGGWQWWLRDIRDEPISENNIRDGALRFNGLTLTAMSNAALVARLIQETIEKTEEELVNGN